MGGSQHSETSRITTEMTSEVSLLLVATLVVIVPSSMATFGKGGGGGHGGGHGGYGHGGSSGIGTACIVKGSYCQCHYCKCEKGHVSCKGHGHKGGGYGKKYCYGGTEGEYCHCDYCKCKHGFGQDGYGKGCKGHK